MRAKLAALVMLVASAAGAQNAKETCIQASERGQRLLDERRMLEARNAFLSCAQDSCPAAVKRDCEKQLEELKKNLPSVVVRVKDKDGSDVAHGAVSLDGTKIGDLDGRDLEVDPGTHKLHIELPDGRTFDRQIILAAGEHARAVTFDANAPASSLGEGVPDVQFDRKHAASNGGGWTAVRTIGFTGIVVGGVGLVIGGIFLGLQISNEATAGTSSENQCPIKPDPVKCTNALNAAKADQVISLASFIAGTAVLATGVVLFIVGKNKPAASAWHVAPMVGPKLGGLSFGASF